MNQNTREIYIGVSIYKKVGTLYGFRLKEYNKTAKTYNMGMDWHFHYYLWEKSLLIPTYF